MGSSNAPTVPLATRSIVEASLSNGGGATIDSSSEQSASTFLITESMLISFADQQSLSSFESVSCSSTSDVTEVDLLPSSFTGDDPGCLRDAMSSAMDGFSLPVSDFGAVDGVVVGLEDGLLDGTNGSTTIDFATTTVGVIGW